MKSILYRADLRIIRWTISCCFFRQRCNFSDDLFGLFLNVIHGAAHQLGLGAAFLAGKKPKITPATTENKKAMTIIPGLKTNGTLSKPAMKYDPAIASANKPPKADNSQGGLAPASSDIRLPNVVLHEHPYSLMNIRRIKKNKQCLCKFSIIDLS